MSVAQFLGKLEEEERFPLKEKRKANRHSTTHCDLVYIVNTTMLNYLSSRSFPAGCSTLEEGQRQLRHHCRRVGGQGHPGAGWEDRVEP